MFLFIIRFLKGLVIGWIISLMMFMVKRMLSKAFGAGMLDPHKKHPQQRSQQRSSNPYTPRSANENSPDVVETIWVGMTLTQLLKSFGSPQSKQYMPNGEVWTYANLNGQGTQTAITLEHGTVARWQDIRQGISGPSAAPAP